ncbi:hypothetical protein VD0002_g6334 [Verticillium dahliae]|nr:hypothetical protein VD0003_g2790 [Verticillium dahliae]PNH61493.1 hypothetical protein VD0002_g6334 [Verticillium dahliae]
MAPSDTLSKHAFDNSGDGPIRVPGFNRVMFDEQCQPGKDAYSHPGQSGPFSHGINGWCAHILTVRERAMMRLMDAITDKPNWQVKIFDDDITSKWFAEASAIDELISQKAWDWCVEELRDKAAAFEATGAVLVYDTASRCVKGDNVVSAELTDELKAGVAPLLNVPEKQKDYHPGSNDQVLNLVHPSLFALRYGITRVLSQGGRVDLNDLLASTGLGEVAPIVGADRNIDGRFWSSFFQWLPSEVEFKGDTGTDVQITSYINNLHPEKHKDLYHTIEKLIGLSVPLFNQALVRSHSGRAPPRILTYGASTEPEFPDWAEYTNLEARSVNDAAFPELWERVKAYLSQPDRADFERDPDEIDEDDSDEEVNWPANPETVPGTLLLARLKAIVEDDSHASRNGYQFKSAISEALTAKWKRIRHFPHPEPGTSTTYEQWKQGSKKPIINSSNIEVTTTDTEETEFTKQKPYDVAIEKEFRDRGLQVIVKLSSIELTPEKPNYAGGSWHVEGMKNEHIVATAIYYYDVENVTESRLSFRQEVESEDSAMDFSYEQGEFEGLEKIFGVESFDSSAAVQELGSVSTRQGRMLVFPNTLQHAVGSFGLVDRTKPGHRRFIVLWLVDPNDRICSTRNVPPQQHDWWAEKRLAEYNFRGLPQEIVNMVGEEVSDYPMSLKKAKELRLDLMKERTRMVEAVENQFGSFNLCEH